MRVSTYDSLVQAGKLDNDNDLLRHMIKNEVYPALVRSMCLCEALNGGPLSERAIMWANVSKNKSTYLCESKLLTALERAHNIKWKDVAIPCDRCDDKGNVSRYSWDASARMHTRVPKTCPNCKGTKTYQAKEVDVGPKK